MKSTIHIHTSTTAKQHSNSKKINSFDRLHGDRLMSWSNRIYTDRYSYSNHSTHSYIRIQYRYIYICIWHKVKVKCGPSTCFFTKSLGEYCTYGCCCYCYCLVVVLRLLLPVFFLCSFISCEFINIAHWSCILCKRTPHQSVDHIRCRLCADIFVFPQNSFVIKYP